MSIFGKNCEDSPTPTIVNEREVLSYRVYTHSLYYLKKRYIHVYIRDQKGKEYTIESNRERTYMINVEREKNAPERPYMHPSITTKRTKI
jgi:hypothetical protein